MPAWEYVKSGSEFVRGHYAEEEQIILGIEAGAEGHACESSARAMAEPMNSHRNN
jgi:hypothetical protein